jgi:hypothetical protein
MNKVNKFFVLFFNSHYIFYLLFIFYLIYLICIYFHMDYIRNCMLKCCLSNVYKLEIDNVSVCKQLQYILILM